MASEPIPHELDTTLRLGDFLSLGYWALRLASEIGLPSTDTISSWAAGDWEKVSRAADACANLGEYCRELAREARTEMSTLQDSWTGNASTAASLYFGDLADTLDSNAAAFAEMGRQLDQTAVGVHQSAKLIGDVMQELADLAIVLGVEAAAAAVTAPTGVGLLASSAAIAGTLWIGYQKVSSITEIHSRAMILCEAVVGLTATPLATIKGFSTVEVPAPYDNTWVTR